MNRKTELDLRRRITSLEKAMERLSAKILLRSREVTEPDQELLAIINKAMKKK